MTSTNRLTVLLISLFFACSTTSAQEYLVTTKGDTLRGELKVMTSSSIDNVRISIEKKKASFSALEVRALFMNGETYKPMRFENTIQFMKVLKAGYLTLYAFRPANIMTYDGRYLAKMDGGAIEIPSLTYKKTLSKFLEDCPTISDKIKDDQFKRGELEKIIDEYNACVDSRTSKAINTISNEASASEKLEIIKQLQAKVEALEQLNDRKDVIDLLSDISTKVLQQQSISNYQLEALKNYLKGFESVKEELEKVITVIRPK
jgi:hypothetical protein